MVRQSPRLRRGIGPTLAAVLATLATSAPAQAHDTSGDHADPIREFTRDGGSTTQVRPGGRAPTDRALAQSCNGVRSTADDGANATFPASSRVIKVVYAYPTDVGDRFSTYAPVIQSGVRLMTELVAGESGNSRSLRFDLGTAEGPACLDIQTLPLTGASSTYAANPSLAFSLLRTEVLARVAAQPGSRNFLVYADGVAIPGVGGEAQVRSDDSYAGALQGLGGLFAVVYGRGGTDFIGSKTSFPAGTTSRAHVDLALHEVSHTMGAVQSSAPHRSAAHHCLDEYDVLCYDDDGNGGMSTFTACPTPSAQAWDCGKDDYFNPSPPPGSYLATHWNLFNSVFMCAVSSCAPGGVSGPPTFASAATPAPLDTRIFSGPRKATLDRTPTFRFDASEPGATFACRVDRGRFTPCRSPYTARRLGKGRHRFEVYALARERRDPDPAVRGFTVKLRSKPRRG